MKHLKKVQKKINKRILLGEESGVDAGGIIIPPSIINL